MEKKDVRAGLDLTRLDLGMVANDVTEALSRYHDLDVGDDDVMRALPAFLEQVVANALASEAADSGEGNDA